MIPSPPGRGSQLHTCDNPLPGRSYAARRRAHGHRRTHPPPACHSRPQRLAPFPQPEEPGHGRQRRDGRAGGNLPVAVRRRIAPAAGRAAGACRPGSRRYRALSVAAVQRAGHRPGAGGARQAQGHVRRAVCGCDRRTRRRRRAGSRRRVRRTARGWSCTAGRSRRTCARTRAAWYPHVPSHGCAARPPSRRTCGPVRGKVRVLPGISDASADSPRTGSDGRTATGGGGRTRRRILQSGRTRNGPLAATFRHAGRCGSGQLPGGPERSRRQRGSRSQARAASTVSNSRMANGLRPESM